MKTIFRAAVAALLCVAAMGAQADGYPAKPIRLLIAAPPGGGTDGIGRIIAEALGNILKQPVVPENKGGASGVIASDMLVKAAPDGYTLMVTQNGHTTNPAMFRKLPYDTFRDFTPIAPLASSPLVLVAATATGARNLKDVVEMGRRDPATMNFAAAESSTRLATEQLSEATGVKMTSVSYKGTGPAVSDLAAGHVNFGVTTMASVLPFKDTGRMNFIGVLDARRSSFLPDVPTLAEQGYPGIEVRGWWGVFGPANMPAAVVEQLNGAIRTALATASVQKQIAKFQATPWMGSSADLDSFVRREVPSIQRLAKQAGIEAE